MAQNNEAWQGAPHPYPLGRELTGSIVRAGLSFRAVGLGCGAQSNHERAC
jgi:hypothetical protein